MFEQRKLRSVCLSGFHKCTLKNWDTHKKYRYYPENQIVLFDNVEMHQKQQTGWQTVQAPSGAV